LACSRRFGRTVSAAAHALKHSNELGYAADLLIHGLFGLHHSVLGLLIGLIHYSFGRLDYPVVIWAPDSLRIFGFNNLTLALCDLLMLVGKAHQIVELLLLLGMTGSNGI
jgi:hypothetical protein